MATRLSALRVLVSVVSLCGPACNAGPLAAVPPAISNETHHVFSPHRALDLLFVIDNSPSMEDEQTNVAANFKALIEQLEKLEGGMPSVRIAVVTSDLDADTGSSGSCTDREKTGEKPGEFQFKFVGTDTPCGIRDGGTFIEAEQTPSGLVSNLEDGKTLESVFSCMAKRGTNGCGYEHQLQAIRVALLATQPNFVRPDAYLGIIVITDEDDCSAPPASNGFFHGDNASFVDQAASYRCAVDGHTCKGVTLGNQASSVALSSCEATPKPKSLIPIDEIVGHVAGLKPGHPEALFVSAITGWPLREEDVATAKHVVAKTSDGWDLMPVCGRADGATSGGAMPALRMRSFVDAFGANGSLESICAADFRPALSRIGDRLRALLEQQCLKSLAHDGAPTTPGFQPGCSVVEETLNAAGTATKSISLPLCDSGAAPPCFRLVANKSCGTGASFQIDRAGQPASPSSRVVVACDSCSAGETTGCSNGL